MARQGREYKPTEADRLFVERAVMAGSKIEDIASALNIHDDTLRKHYRYEIMTSRERLKGEAVRVLLNSLTDGSLDAAKFVLARQAGWVEKISTELTGKDGGPIKTEASFDLAAMTDEELAAYHTLAAATQRDRTGD